MHPRIADENVLPARPGEYNPDQPVSECCVIDFVVEVVESGVDFFERVIVTVRVIFW
jgi:hypothetical protein